jgi:putative ABC transport system permease protein
MTSVWQDVRFGLRMLAKNPGFAAVAILTLALGIAATTTIFSVIDSVLLNPFPYKNAHRLATASIRLPGGAEIPRFPVAAFLDFKEQNHTFDDMIGLAYLGVRFWGREGTQSVQGGWVTSDAFGVLGSRPVLGRPLTSEDGKPGSPPVFVMSYQLWVKEFNKDPKALGITLDLNGTPRTLIAVMPPRFHFGGCEIWIPLSLNRDTFIPGFGIVPNELWTLGHLKRGVSAQTAESDLQVIAMQREREYPAFFRPQYKMRVNTLQDYSVGRFKPALFPLMGAVGMLLMIACSNVANLLLARATVREREIAIRASLGASRGRLVRQLLVESFILATASCIAGYVLAFWGLKGVAAVIPVGIVPSEVDIGLHPATLIFAMGVAVATALLCSVTPAIHAARRDLRIGLARAGKGTTKAVRHGKLRSAQVIAEVAVSIVLLIGSGLMVRSLLALERINLGFDPNKVLYMDLALPEGRYDTADQIKTIFRKILDRINAIPGVTAAAVTSSVPPYSWGGTDVRVQGKTQDELSGITFIMCSEGYFETLGRHLLRGRLLTQRDIDSARRVAVINEALARAYFQDGNPVGRGIKLSTFEMYFPDWPRDAYLEIVGVVADANNSGLEDPPRPEAYMPHTLTGGGNRMIVMRTAGNSGGVQASVRRNIGALDTDIAISEVGTVESYLKQWYFAKPQFILMVLGAFATIGLVLVIMGVFSMMAYTVSLRTHEIGIRMALGAQERDVLRMVLKNGLGLLTGGAIAGVIVSLALTHLMASQIWGVSATDPWTFATVVLVILVAGLAACFLPARRATRVNPLIALHSE